MAQIAEQAVSTETFIKERKYLMNFSEGTLKFYEDTFRSVFKHGDFSEEGLKRWVVGSRDAGNTPRTLNCRITGTVVHGSSGNIVITGTPVGGYTGTVTFTCGTVPTGASGLFAPASLNFSGNNTAASTTLTFGTVTTVAMLESLPGRTTMGPVFVALLLLPLGFLSKKS